MARAESAHDGAVEQLREAEQAAAPLAASRAAVNEKLRAAEGQVTELEVAYDLAALPEASRLAREAAAAAAGALAEAQRNAAVHDADAIARRIESIDARARSAQERRQQLEREISRLEAIVETEGGKGLAERVATLTEEAEAAAAASTRVEEEAETLKLLADTLEQARSDTSQAFLGPVARRAKRHIHRLLPGCDLTFSEDLGLQSILRGGMSEGCSHLSKGTQEQLAVLTRLAFADLLLDDGRPVSLILDDPLVYSDDARLDLMTDILTDAAERMQVILLTCRERAFRHPDGDQDHGRRRRSNFLRRRRLTPDPGNSRNSGYDAGALKQACARVRAAVAGRFPA